MKAGASPLFHSDRSCTFVTPHHYSLYIRSQSLQPPDRVAGQQRVCNTAHTEEAVLRRGPLRPTLSAALAASDAVCFRGYKTRQLC